VRDLRERVIVVTGGSSGIGRATVEQLLDAGATVVAVARGDATLHEVAADLAGRPGRLETAALDVADAAAVDRLAADVADRHGRIDGWVNVAGTTTYGRFESIPVDEFDRVVAVNLLGTANGARAVLPGFRAQGSGVVINVASVLGRIGTPLMSAYVASKFGVRGLSESLRMELRDEPDVHVCTVLPSSVDTPLFQHAGNRTGEHVESPSLPMDPHRVAATIVSCLRRPRREVIVGHAPRLLLAARAVAPGATERWIGAAMAWDHTGGGDVDPTAGSLASSRADGEVTGGWRAAPVPSAGRLAKLAVHAATGAVTGGIAALGHRVADVRELSRDDAAGPSEPSS
jgi:short-subunit dehydrogenase